MKTDPSTMRTNDRNIVIELEVEEEEAFVTPTARYQPYSTQKDQAMERYRFILLRPEAPIVPPVNVNPLQLVPQAPVALSVNVNPSQPIPEAPRITIERAQSWGRVPGAKIEKECRQNLPNLKQKREAENLLNNEIMIFARDTNDLDQTNLMVHEIDMGRSYQRIQKPLGLPNRHGSKKEWKAA
ncbi:10546_t:CDS:2, partial [Racocetra fulgida]